MDDLAIMTALVDRHSLQIARIRTVTETVTPAPFPPFPRYSGFGSMMIFGSRTFPLTSTLYL